MNSQFDEAARRPSDTYQTDAHTSSSAAAFYEPTAESVVTFTYSYETPEPPRHFSFAHDPARGLVVVTSPDGTPELLRDNPVRFLVVESDPHIGDLRPTADVTSSFCKSSPIGNNLATMLAMPPQCHYNIQSA